MIFAEQDSLERRYDGPIPPADPAHAGQDAAGRARLFQRLLEQARRQMATRRLRLAARAAAIDPHLSRLGRDLALYRTQQLAWRSP